MSQSGSQLNPTQPTMSSRVSELIYLQIFDFYNLFYSTIKMD